MTTAWNRRIDPDPPRSTLASKARLLDVPEAIEDAVDETTIADKRLELVFTCCHPALALDAPVALTLRTLGGLSTEEIARAFSSPRRQWPKRLVRAKRKVRAAGSRFACRQLFCLPTAAPRCSHR